MLLPTKFAIILHQCANSLLCNLALRLAGCRRGNRWNKKTESSFSAVAFIICLCHLNSTLTIMNVTCMSFYKLHHKTILFSSFFFFLALRCLPAPSSCCLLFWHLLQQFLAAWISLLQTLKLYFTMVIFNFKLIQLLNHCESKINLWLKALGTLDPHFISVCFSYGTSF